MNRHQIVGFLLLLPCGAAQADTPPPAWQADAERLEAFLKSPAASLVAPALDEARAALDLLNKKSTKAEDAALQSERLQLKLREAEILLQNRQNQEASAQLQTQYQRNLIELRYAQTQRTLLQENRRQQQAAAERESALQAQLTRENERRQLAETQLAQLAQERQRAEDIINLALGQFAEVWDDAEGKHLRLGFAPLFGEGKTLTPEALPALKNLAILLQAIPNRRHLLLIKPFTGDPDPLILTRLDQLKTALTENGLGDIQAAYQDAVPEQQVELLLLLAPMPLNPPQAAPLAEPETANPQ